MKILIFQGMVVTAIEEEDGSNLKEEHGYMINQDVSPIQDEEPIMIK